VLLLRTHTLHEISHGTSSSTISICFVDYAYLASCVCDDIPKARYYHEYANLVLNVHYATLTIPEIFLGNTACSQSVNSNAKTYQLDPTQNMSTRFRKHNCVSSS
jgi:hypothetical protein